MVLVSDTTTHGYSLAGGSDTPSNYTASDVIDRWSFSSDGNAVDVGNLTVGRKMGCRC